MSRVDCFACSPFIFIFYHRFAHRLDLLAMVQAVNDASLLEQVTKEQQTVADLETLLQSTPVSLSTPLIVLALQQALLHIIAIVLQFCVKFFTDLAAKQVVAEEKTIDPEIEARLAAERAKEEAMYDAATLARIREKRAAKEAKKNKKAAGKKDKKLNVGNGVQAIQQEIQTMCPTLYVKGE